jgi:hypothetical protein
MAQKPTSKQVSFHRQNRKIIGDGTYASALMMLSESLFIAAK